MSKTLSLTLVVLLFLHAAAMANPMHVTPVSGTFVKGPAVGGTIRFIGPDVLVIRGEEGSGSVTGGILTGPADYTFRYEIIDFAAQIGTFRTQVEIRTGHGSAITLGLVGFTSGVTPDAEVVTVSGTWVVVSASGRDAGLRGEGQFLGTENFQTGETQGTFSGLLHQIDEDR